MVIPYYMQAFVFLWGIILSINYWQHLLIMKIQHKYNIYNKIMRLQISQQSNYGNGSNRKKCYLAKI